MFRNLKLIQSAMIKLVTGIVMAFSAVSLLLGKPGWAMSSILGAVFSFYVFNKLLKSQSYVLKTKNKNNVFIPYLTRLGIIAIPLLVSFIFKDHVSLIVVIIFLFSFQFLYIIFELKKNYNRYQKRKKQWTNSEK
ncbi:hypothetical protein DID80_08260 [Candidatus Marinamargulisbacteria bacterium SCGC AAA071-K20]|nr:hypothetical protein DID80_08260 [Candidatus Marinamargulisbacteria bacterium SCGC AAA071-K20]